MSTSGQPSLHPTLHPLVVKLPRPQSQFFLSHRVNSQASDNEKRQVTIPSWDTLLNSIAICIGHATCTFGHPWYTGLKLAHDQTNPHVTTQSWEATWDFQEEAPCPCTRGGSYAYIDDINKLIPLRNGTIKTTILAMVYQIGVLTCWGGTSWKYLFSKEHTRSLCLVSFGVGSSCHDQNHGLAKTSLPNEGIQYGSLLPLLDSLVETCYQRPVLEES